MAGWVVENAKEESVRRKGGESSSGSTERKPKRMDGEKGSGRGSEKARGSSAKLKGEEKSGKRKSKRKEPEPKEPEVQTAPWVNVLMRLKSMALNAKAG
jgi:hypothetical protein